MSIKGSRTTSDYISSSYRIWFLYGTSYFRSISFNMGFIWRRVYWVTWIQNSKV